LTGETDNVTIQIRYKDVEKTFSGTPEQVWLLLNKFFGDFLPTFETAKKLLLNVDVQRLAKDCEGLIAFSKEGPNLMVAREKLTDNETLTLWLLANYVGFQLGATKKETVSKEELQIKLGKNPKIASTRLGELVKNGKQDCQRGIQDHNLWHSADAEGDSAKNKGKDRLARL